ncbi:MAG TPA: hypothetical protein VG146_14080 [Verrucomicrobiae bacterium]|nr:hypothetical protein [Verrucomicrobiae bacterium]
MPKVLLSPNLQISRRFTLDGSDALESRLEAICAQVREGACALVPTRRLEALVLGGGYGRGEGGVLQSGAGDAPYNDLEFYMFLRGSRLRNERMFQRGLHALGERLGSTAGLDIEFKIESLPRFRDGPVSMFSYDLVSAHRLIAGPEDLFENCQSHLDAGRIPLEEATRLLLNRCTGLLLARELLDKWALAPTEESATMLSRRGSSLSPSEGERVGERDPSCSPSPSPPTHQMDFIGRNLAKLKLALGDALLAALGQYHWSCLERHRRVQDYCAGNLPDPGNRNRCLPPLGRSWLNAAAKLHAAGLEFKLHPTHTFKSAPEFSCELEELSALALELWLWLESRRLGRRFLDERDYALSSIPKSLGASPGLNCLLHLRTFGIAALGQGSWRYPRERLFQSLPLLLWSGERLGEVLPHLQGQLRTRAATWRQLVQAYKRLWRIYA